MTGAWPWPNDSALMRARRVAASYRAVLEDSDPGACHELDARMAEMGIDWIVPQIVSYTDDDWLSAEQVAAYAGVSLSTAYSWRQLGLKSIATNEGIRFRYGHLRRWLAGDRKPR